MAADPFKGAFDSEPPTAPEPSDPFAGAFGGEPTPALPLADQPDPFVQDVMTEEQARGISRLGGEAISKHYLDQLPGDMPAELREQLAKRLAVPFEETGARVWWLLDKIDRPSNAVRGAVYTMALNDLKAKRGGYEGMDLGQRFKSEAEDVGRAIADGWWGRKNFTGEGALKHAGILADSPGWRSAAGIAMDLIMPEPTMGLGKPLKAMYKTLGKGAETAIVKAGLAGGLNNVLNTRIGMDQAVKTTLDILDALPGQRRQLEGQLAMEMARRQKVITGLAQKRVRSGGINPLTQRAWTLGEATDYEKAKLFAAMEFKHTGEGKLIDALEKNMGITDVEAQELVKQFRADNAMTLYFENLTPGIKQIAALSDERIEYAAHIFTDDYFKQVAKKGGARHVDLTVGGTIDQVEKEVAHRFGSKRTFESLSAEEINEVLWASGDMPKGIKAVHTDPVYVNSARAAAAIKRITGAKALKEIARHTGKAVDMDELRRVLGNAKAISKARREVRQMAPEHLKDVSMTPLAAEPIAAAKRFDDAARRYENDLLPKQYPAPEPDWTPQQAAARREADRLSALRSERRKFDDYPVEMDPVSDTVLAALEQRKVISGRDELMDWVRSIDGTRTGIPGDDTLRKMAGDAGFDALVIEGVPGVPRYMRSPMRKIDAPEYPKPFKPGMQPAPDAMVRAGRDKLASGELDSLLEATRKHQRVSDDEVGEFATMIGMVAAVEEKWGRRAALEVEDFLKQFDGHKIYTKGVLKGRALPDDVAEWTSQWMAMQRPREIHKLWQRIDQITTWWKAWGLGVRPSYHSRNWLQNLVAADAAGVKDPRDYFNFLTIQRAAKRRGRQTEAGELIRDTEAHKFLQEAVLTKTGGGVRKKAAANNPVVSIGGEPVTYEKLHDEFVARLGDLGEYATTKAAFTPPVSAAVQPTGKLRELAEKVGRGMPFGPVKDNHILRFTFGFGTGLENNARGAVFMNRLRRMADPVTGALPANAFEDAARHVKKYLYDYSSESLSQIEREWGRRIFPFYGFTRRNIPAQLEQLLTQPWSALKIHKIKRNIESANEVDDVPESVLREWQRDGLAIQLGRSEEDRNVYKALVLGSYLGIADLEKVSAVGNLAETVAMMVSPLVKTAAELTSLGITDGGMNVMRSIQQGRIVPIDGGADVMPFGIEMDARSAHFLNGMLAINDFDRFNPLGAFGEHGNPEDRRLRKDVSATERFVQYLMGARIYKSDALKARRDRLVGYQNRIRQLEDTMKWRSRLARPEDPGSAIDPKGARQAREEALENVVEIRRIIEHYKKLIDQRHEKMGAGK